MSIGLILGPVLGGVIYARSGYYAAFGLGFGFIGLDLVLRVVLVEKKIAVRYTSATSDGNIGSAKLQPIQGRAPETEADDGTSNLRTEACTPSPVLNTRSWIPPIFRILKYPRLLVALFLSFVQALILSAFDATLPLYLNALFSYTALQAGIVFGLLC